MEIRDSDFEEMVLSSDRPVLVDFWASWCPPCKMMQPMVDRLATKVGDWADVYSVNIDRSPGLASQYQVSGVPTFIAFAGGQPIERRTGALTEGQMMDLLKKAEEAMPPESTDARLLEEAGHLSPAETRPYITIVSGLPRSGTSMMMRMLEAGGIPALTDELRTPDEDNPNGYYEFADVKSIEGNADWLNDAPGYSVKMVYSLLKHLPIDRDYRIVFMRREVSEILLSQKKMLERSGIETDISDATMKALFERELRQFYVWLPSQSHLNLINISYNELLSRPQSTIALINNHFDETLDVHAMNAMVDQSLYRHRAA
ncbi:MAG TPA: thioredoxin [Planctomycetaceae bacterium]|nr:thioredoxin [Planctomycetaceae bacterium]